MSKFKIGDRVFLEINRYKKNTEIYKGAIVNIISEGYLEIKFDVGLTIVYEKSKIKILGISNPNSNIIIKETK